MARPKKPKYEYVEKLNLFRKRVKDIHGKYVAVYGRTPDELTEKLLEFNKQQEQGAENKDSSAVKLYTLSTKQSLIIRRCDYHPAM